MKFKVHLHSEVAYFFFIWMVCMYKTSELVWKPIMIQYNLNVMWTVETSSAHTLNDGLLCEIRDMLCLAFKLLKREYLHSHRLWIFQ